MSFSLQIQQPSNKVLLNSKKVQSCFELSKVKNSCSEVNIVEWRKNLKKDESRVGRLLSGKYTSLILIFHFQITVHLESKTFSMRPPLLLPKPKHSIVQKKIPQPRHIMHASMYLLFFNFLMILFSIYAEQWKKFFSMRGFYVYE